MFGTIVLAFLFVFVVLPLLFYLGVIILALLFSDKNPQKYQKVFKDKE